MLVVIQTHIYKGNKNLPIPKEFDHDRENLQ